MRAGEGGVLRGRRVLSLVPGSGGVAVWWQVGRIRAVGGAAAIDRQAPRHLPRFECAGSLITPGFVDGHTHFAMWAMARRRVRLAGARTRGEAVARVAIRQGLVQVEKRKSRAAPPSLRPVTLPVDMKDSLRDVADPELRECLESLARGLTAGDGAPAVATIPVVGKIGERKR